MSSSTNKMSSSEYSCNDTSAPSLITAGSGRYASITSMKPSSCSIEIAHEVISDSKESQQVMENMKSSSNHASVGREGEERPNLKATSVVSHSSYTKNYTQMSNSVKYIYEKHPHIQAPSMVATNHQFNTVDGHKGSASFSSLPPQPLGSRIINANSSRSTLRYTPVQGDLSNSTLESSAMEPRGFARSIDNPTFKPAASTGQSALVPSAHSTTSAPPAAAISNSIGDTPTEGHHSDVLRGARHPLSVPRYSDAGNAFIPERPLVEEGSDPPRRISSESKSAAAATSHALREGNPDDAAQHRLATGIGPRLDCSGPHGGKVPSLCPETMYSLATRSDAATAVPSELTLIGAHRSKPPQRPRQPETGTLPEDIFRQPTRALTVQLVALYKYINARYWHQRRMEAPGPKYNNGYDDKDGHYIVLPGEEILNRFTVQEVLGKGSFGTVIRCYDEKRHEAVALKITRHGFNFREQAKLELDILLKLNENANLNHLVVKLLKVFDWQGHLVLMFELLSFNLYQLIKCTRYKGVCLDLVCKFAYQLVCTLRQLEQQKPQPIIHCDLKPENILLKNQNRSGIRLIDFGSACYADRRIHHYIQSRFYRSPEVILDLDYSTAIDRWSLGCVLVELHTGIPLFDGRSEAEQLARFESVLGPLPTAMLESSSKALKYYNLTPQGTYELKAPPQQRRSLESILGMTRDTLHDKRKDYLDHNEVSCHTFLDFIYALLKYRPQKRISCTDALHHPFFSSLLSTKRDLSSPAGAVSVPTTTT